MAVKQIEWFDRLSLIALLPQAAYAGKATLRNSLEEVNVKGLEGCKGSFLVAIFISLRSKAVGRKRAQIPSPSYAHGIEEEAFCWATSI